MGFTALTEPLSVSDRAGVEPEPRLAAGSITAGEADDPLAKDSRRPIPLDSFRRVPIRHRPPAGQPAAADDKRRAPQSYEELLSRYSAMVLSMATRMGIPEPDREDALSEVVLRFWQKDGLALYNPELVVDRPERGWRDGRTQASRNPSFTAFFRQWTFLNLMAVRDRCRSWRSHAVLGDVQELNPVFDTNNAQRMRGGAAISRTNDTLRDFRTTARELLADEPELLRMLDVILTLSLDGAMATPTPLAKEMGLPLDQVRREYARLKRRLAPLRAMLVA